MISLDELLGKLNGTVRKGDKAKACCPAHNDSKPSLSVSPGKGGRLLVRCMAGCKFKDIVAALGLEEQDFFSDRPKKNLTLDEFATAKKLPKDYLGKRGVIQLVDGGVGIQYKDDNGNVVALKKRTHVIAKKGSFWPKGVPHMAYGIEHLSAARFQRHLILVEGETDQLSLDHAGFPALGIPGADATKTIEARFLEDHDLRVARAGQRRGEVRPGRGGAAAHAQLGWRVA
jgi:hypothetical protein